VDAAVRGVLVALHFAEAGSLVDGDRSAVERGNRERVVLGAERRRREAQSGEKKRASEPTADEVRPEPEADVRAAVAELEDEQADELVLAVVGREIPPAPFRRVERLRQVVGVLVPVVERVDPPVVPRGDGSRGSLGDRPDDEVTGGHVGAVAVGKPAGGARATPGPG